jgi:hypothetical protein
VESPNHPPTADGGDTVTAPAKRHFRYRILISDNLFTPVGRDPARPEEVSTMNPRRLTLVIASPILALLATVVPASPATAATIGDKVTVMGRWTQSALTSYNNWNAARQNRTAWTDYTFDWSTDYCSVSPDNPLGFDFKMPCARHDFGYRNYKAVGRFPDNKGHVDDAFYADLRRRCDGYNKYVRPSCDSLAWTYYQAVRVFGNLAVSQADLDRAARLKAQGELQATAAARNG